MKESSARLARATPRRPPARARMQPSARAPWKSLQAEAPRAERRAISRSRVMERASWALARLMQAMRRTLRTAAKRSQTLVVVLRTMTCLSGWMSVARATVGGDHLLGGIWRGMLGQTGASWAWAWAGVAPGLRRPRAT